MSAEPIIQLENVWAGYDQDPVLEEVNFCLYPQDYVGVIGPNGGGKSTFIKVILGLIEPYRGCVRLFGQSPRRGRRYLAYVPQLLPQNNNFPVRVWDLVAMGRLAPGLHPWARLTAEDLEAIDTALKQTDILDLQHRTMDELSGGQRQRAFVARALACQPRVLLLDEPTANLDSRASTQFYQLLHTLNKTISILIVSHDITKLAKQAKTMVSINHRLVYLNTEDLNAEVLGTPFAPAFSNESGNHD